MFDWDLNTPLVLIIKCHTLQSAPSEKVELKKKRTLCQNSLYWSKAALNDKLEIADIKYDNNFSLKLQPKNS